MEQLQPVGLPAVRRDSCLSSLSLLPMFFWTWSLQKRAKTLFGIVFAKFMFYFGKELGTFGYAVDVFPTEN
jgi:hypothetical protein